MRAAVVSTGQGKFGQVVRVGRHTLLADVPAEEGGDDMGPAPHEWILAGLAACTSMTLKVYADRKGWALASVEVRVEGEHRDGVYVLTREVVLGGNLSPEQRARLLEMASRCPVHKSLSGPIRIDTAETSVAP